MTTIKHWLLIWLACLGIAAVAALMNPAGDPPIYVIKTNPFPFVIPVRPQ